MYVSMGERKVPVYRVEKPKGGRGPYSLPETIGLHIAHSDGLHPDPCGDGLDRLSPKEYCGFATLLGLHRWFDGWQVRLSELGFAVAVYSVTPHLIRYARRQLVFRRGDLLPTYYRSLVE